MSESAEKVAHRALKRSKAVEELIKTEETYVDQLTKLVQYFADQLKDFKIITEKDYLTLFPNDLRTIALLNTTLLEDLKKRCNPFDNNETKISDILINFAPYFKMYQAYMNNHEMAVRTLKKLEDSSRTFEKFIQDRRHHFGNLHLSSLLILPVQRIPRYKIITSEIVKNTEPHHPDRKQLNEALEKIMDVNRANNEKLREIEARAEVMRCESELEGIKDLVTPSRCFIKQSELHKLEGDKRVSLMFYLFNDIMIAAKMSEGLFSNKRQIKFKIPVDSAFSVESFEDTAITKNCFAVHSCIESFMVYSESEKTKQSWVSALQSSILTWNESLSGGISKEAIRAPLVIPLSYSTFCMRCNKDLKKTQAFTNCGYCGHLICDSCAKFALPDKSDKHSKTPVCGDCYNSSSKIQSRRTSGTRVANPLLQELKLKLDKNPGKPPRLLRPKTSGDSVKASDDTSIIQHSARSLPATIARRGSRTKIKPPPPKQTKPPPPKPMKHVSPPQMKAKPTHIHPLPKAEGRSRSPGATLETRPPPFKMNPKPTKQKPNNPSSSRWPPPKHATKQPIKQPIKQPTKQPIKQPIKQATKQLNKPAQQPPPPASPIPEDIAHKFSMSKKNQKPRRTAPAASLHKVSKSCISHDSVIRIKKKRTAQPVLPMSQSTAAVTPPQNGDNAGGGGLPKLYLFDDDEDDVESESKVSSPTRKFPRSPPPKKMTTNAFSGHISRPPKSKPPPPQPKTFSVSNPAIKSDFGLMSIFVWRCPNVHSAHNQTLLIKLKKLSRNVSSFHDTASAMKGVQEGLASPSKVPVYVIANGDNENLELFTNLQSIGHKDECVVFCSDLHSNQWISRFPNVIGTSSVDDVVAFVQNRVYC